MLTKATQLVSSQILHNSVALQPSEHVYLLYDTNSPMSRILAQAYSQLQTHQVEAKDFYSIPLDEVLQRISKLRPKDLVVTVQTSSFNFNQYRLRIELFKAGIKNVDHVHLELIDNDQLQNYIDSLAFDPVAEAPSARKLKETLDNASRVVAQCYGGTELVYEGGMEPALVNCGDYTGMPNIGGTFPVGEVFTEPKDLSQVNGQAMVFAFPNTSRKLQLLEEPIKITIDKGEIVAFDRAKAPKEFAAIIDGVKQAEETALIREFGLGINKAIGKHAMLGDVTAFERQEGWHVSLGKKHTVYKKAGIKAKQARLHIDLFLDLDQLHVDEKLVFNKGKLLL